MKTNDLTKGSQSVLVLWFSGYDCLSIFITHLFERNLKKYIELLITNNSFFIFKTKQKQLKTDVSNQSDITPFRNFKQKMFLFSLFYFTQELFYLFDPSPTIYMKDYPIDFTVGELESSIYKKPLPYNIGDLFCLPSDIEKESSLFGNIAGEGRMNTQYSFSVKNDVYCKSTCKKVYTKEQKELLIKLIDEKYKIKLYADSIPCKTSRDNSTNVALSTFINGFDIGFKETNNSGRGLVPGMHYLYSHLDMELYFKPDKALGTYKLMSFVIRPVAPPNKAPCTFEFPDSIEDTSEFLFTYSLNFKEMEEEPESRFYYAVKQSLNPSENLTIPFAMFVFLFMFEIIFNILFTHHINSLLIDYEDKTTKILKSLKSDIFRPPTRPLLWASLVANGFHILCVGMITIGLCGFLVLSPAKNASIPKTVYIFYVLLSPFIGYLNQYLYSLTSSTTKKFAVLKSSFLSNVIPLVLYTVLNIFLGQIGSTEHLSMERFILIIFTFFLTMIFHAAGVIVCIAFRRPKPIGECSVFPRKIPEVYFFSQPEIVDFGIGYTVFCAFLPMERALLNSSFVSYGLWRMALILFVFMITTFEVSSIASRYIVYIRLKNEDYRWWWSSFKGPALSGLFVFLDIMRTFVSQMYTGSFSYAITFIMKTLLLSIAFGLSCGFYGAFAAMRFVKKIYK